MLKRLKLKNFRAFSDYSIKFKKRNVIVGRNNAGKSTVVEALRIIAIIANRAPYLTFGPISEETEYPLYEYGVKPSLTGTDIDLSNVCHEYRDPPAIVQAFFESGEQIDAYLFNDNYIFAVLKLSDGVPISTKAGARKFRERAVKALPQVGPLQKEERVLKEKSVRQNLYSSLAPQHFRNQLYQFPDFRNKFFELVEKFWPGMRIEDITFKQEPGENPFLILLIRDSRFVAEAAWMGHGLQVWLQVLWFLSRVDENETIIIDEPDVYLHADLQRQMVRYIMNLDNQVILTTHSPEIISEVNPSEVLIIDKREKSAKFANTLPTVQHVLENVGTVQNIYFLRIWSAKCIIFVEGEDLTFLDKIHSKLNPLRTWSIGALPNMVIRGWGGWKYVLGSTILGGEESDLDVIRYCILDSDYHLPDEIDKRYKEAEENNIQLHIWKAKEIENYLIVPACIARIIRKRAPGSSVSSEDVEEIFWEATDKLKSEIEDNIGSQLSAQHKGKEYKWFSQKAREIVEDAWRDYHSRRNLVPGKDVLSEMAKISQARYGVSFGVGAVLENLKKEEVDREMEELINRIASLSDVKTIRSDFDS